MVWINKRVVWTGFMWPRKGTTGGPCEQGNEPLGSMQGGEFNKNTNSSQS